MPGPSVSFDRVRLELSGVEILHDVSLKVEAGEIHCVIGPNGGGKTSLIRCLLGHMPHTGEIAIAWGRRRAIGYVPQHLDFDKTLPVTVGDFMAMICQRRRPAWWGLGKASREQAEEALGRVGLAGRLASKFGSLSGGERQRVLFAQALIPEPGLLVLDEPMTSMDEVGSALFTDAIRALSQRGVTIVWIAHELGLVRKMADTVTCIAGTVLFTGRPDETLGALTAEELFKRAAREPLARAEVQT